MSFPAFYSTGFEGGIISRVKFAALSSCLFWTGAFGFSYSGLFSICFLFTYLSELSVESSFSASNKSFIVIDPSPLKTSYSFSAINELRWASSAGSYFTVDFWTWARPGNCFELLLLFFPLWIFFVFVFSSSSDTKSLFLNILSRIVFISGSFYSARDGVPSSWFSLSWFLGLTTTYS